MTLRDHSARREEEAAVRRDVASDLEHDLGSGPEAKRARIASTPAPADVEGDGAAEGGKSARAEPLPPDAKEIAERGPTGVADDPAGVERPDPGAAPRRDGAAETQTRLLKPDGRRDYDHVAACKELDVNTRTTAQRRRTTREARGPRRRLRVIPRPRANRSRHGCRGDRNRRDRGKGAEVHRIQATRAVLCLLACAVVAGLVVAPARADGDPASDYLVAQPAFLSYDAKIPLPAERKLLAAVASATKNGYPVKVALIWSRYDLGSVPELFGKPRTYARFLDAEDSKCWWGGSCGSGRFKTTTRLVVVMPNGLGFAQWKHDPAAGYRTISGIKVERTPVGLATAATTAVVKLAGAAGVKVSTSGGPITVTPTGSGNGTTRIEIVAAVVAALIIGVAARLLIRRRAGRSVAR